MKANYVVYAKHNIQIHLKIPLNIIVYSRKSSLHKGNFLQVTQNSSKSITHPEKSPKTYFANSTYNGLIRLMFTRHRRQHPFTHIVY